MPKKIAVLMKREDGDLVTQTKSHHDLDQGERQIKRRTKSHDKKGGSDLGKKKMRMMIYETL